MQAGVAFKDKYFGSLTKDSNHDIDFVEFMFENLAFNEFSLERASQLASRLPCTLHCTSFNIGGEIPLDKTMLTELKRVISILNPIEVSEHLCFSAHGNTQHHDLLPIAFTPKNLMRVQLRVQQIQEALGRSIALENLSAYVLFKDCEYSEYEFLQEVSKKTGSKILLDLNNLVVNEHNHNHTVDLEKVDLACVSYCHVAGYEVFDGAAIDTHGAHPSERVFSYVDTVRKRGIERFLIEWDQNIPDFDQIDAIAKRLKASDRKIADVQ